MHICICALRPDNAPARKTQHYINILCILNTLDPRNTWPSYAAFAGEWPWTIAGLAQHALPDWVLRLPVLKLFQKFMLLVLQDFAQWFPLGSLKDSAVRNPTVIRQQYSHNAPQTDDEKVESKLHEQPSRC